MKAVSNLHLLVPAAVSLLVAAVAIGISGKVLATIGGTPATEAITNRTNLTAVYNSTTGGIGAMNTFSSYFATIAIVLVASIVIGVIVTSFYFKNK